jgi:Flp pilus assembly protein TadD
MTESSPDGDRPQESKTLPDAPESPTRSQSAQVRDQPEDQAGDQKSVEKETTEPGPGAEAAEAPTLEDVQLEEPEQGDEQGDIFKAPWVAQESNPLADAFRKLREGRGRETANLLHDIVKPGETPFVAHIERGKHHDESGRHELAIEEFLAARELDRENVEALACLATSYGALGRFKEADLAIEEALRLDPENPQAQVGEAILAFRKGLYVEAEVRLKRICVANPSHGPAHFYRGEALNRLGRVQEAVETMERTIQLQPRNWRAYHTLGMLCDRMDDRERASEMYRHARELNRL